MVNYQLNLGSWKAVINRVKETLPGEFYHHPNSRTYKAIYYFGRELANRIRLEAPIRSGALRRAHRYVVKRVGTSTQHGGITHITILLDPNTVGPTGRPFIYGPKVAVKNPWMDRTVRSDMPAMLDDLIGNIESAWRVW